MRLFAVVIPLLIATTFVAGGQMEMKTPKVTFEVVPLKAIYRPNEPIVLRLILTNRGETPVTVEHFSSLCSSDFFAFADVIVLDAAGHPVQGPGCAGDSFLTKEGIEHEVSQVGATDHWIRLDPGDVYGVEETRNWKTRKGRYTIHASFLPARFDEANRKVLAGRGITILFGRITAPDVQISVR